MTRSRLHIPRRDFLRGASALGAASLLPGCKPKGAGDSDTGPGSIDHVVLVMMENRSFDHFFGSLLLEEARTGLDGLTASMSNPLPDGTLVSPFRASTMCPSDPPHDWDSSRKAKSNGTNQGFVQAYYDRYRDLSVAPGVMGYLVRDDVPVMYAMADQYALCQRWFSSVLTSTWPNRLYSHGAQSQGQTGNDLPEGSFFTMKTIWDQLTEAGIDWGYYYSDLPFLGLFGRFNDQIGKVEDFYAACANGTLPTVTMVEPAASFNDDHPPHHPMLGELFLASIHDALAASPLWDRCMLLVYYDEAGGFFDHVVPGTAPDDLADQGFGELGFRVPAVLAGPYVRRQFVSDVDFDHTSPLAHLHGMFGLDALTARDAAANDLSSLIDEDRLAANDPADPVTLPTIELTEEEIEAECDRARKMPSGQLELERVIRETAPWLDRKREIGSVSRAIVDRAVSLGTLVVR